MAVARCGHCVVVRNRGEFEGSEVGQVKQRRVSVKVVLGLPGWMELEAPRILVNSSGMGGWPKVPQEETV